MMREALQSLVTAIENGRTDIVRSIIEACEKCEIEDEGDITVDHLLNSLSTSIGSVLHLATKLDDADTVRALLAAGADPGVHNRDGQTALDLATSPRVCEVFSQEMLQSIAQSNIGRVCQLLAAGVSVNLLDSEDSGNTPLHWAACYANRDMVQCLTKRKAFVDAMNHDGATPIHDAVSRGDLDIVEELIQSGARINIRPHSGKYAGLSIQDLAANNQELAALLERCPTIPQVNGFLNDTIDDETSNQRRPSEDSLPSERLLDSAPTTPTGALPHQKSIEFSPVKVPESKISEKPGNDNGDKAVGQSLQLLWPKPQQIVFREGRRFYPDKTLSVYISPSIKPGMTQSCVSIWKSLQVETESLGLELEIESLPSILTGDELPHVVCEINPRLFHRRQGYRMTVAETKVKVQACDKPGLFYAVQTLLQMLQLCQDKGIPALQIEDWPEIRDRGVLMDISKGRVPKMESLKHHIKTVSKLKVNQIQLYVRFKVISKDEAEWQVLYSRRDILELDSLCQGLQVELVPVLDVAPSVDYLDLVSMRQTFQTFIQCFPSTSIVGIGPRLSSLVVDTTDEGTLHMDEVTSLLPLSDHHVAQLCGFVLHDVVDLLPQVPFKIMVAEYGFQADYDFESHCKSFAESGVPFCVMPGTAGWNSIAGCPEAAVHNISCATKTAVSQRALAMVVAHWAGVGHMTHHSISWPGIMAAAGMAWNVDTDTDFIHNNLAELLNQHVFYDTASITGQVVIELGRAETYILRCSRNQQGTDNSSMPAENGSTLYQLLSHPDHVALENLTPEVFQKTMRHVRKCISELGRVKLSCPEAEQTVAELQLTGDLMLSACRVGRALVHNGRNPSMGHTGYAVINLGVANLPPTQKTDLANRLLLQVDRYRQVWLERCLVPGLQDSLLVLSTMLRQFIPHGHTQGVGGDHL